MIHMHSIFLVFQMNFQHFKINRTSLCILCANKGLKTVYKALVKNVCVSTSNCDDFGPTLLRDWLTMPRGDQKSNSAYSKLHGTSWSRGSAVDVEYLCVANRPSLQELQHRAFFRWG